MHLRNSLIVSSVAALAVGVGGSRASAAVSIAQQATPAPTYSVTLHFDEPGGPTGNVPNNSWAGAPWFIPNFQSGDGVANDVGNHATGTGQGTNSYAGPFGVFINFANDMTELSFQGWDDSGPPTPFGGGAAAAAFNDGVEVANWFGTPAFGGVGDSWFNITTTGGSTFDEVRFLGFSFFPTSYVDNVSWNSVPEPGSLSLLAVTGLGMLRRRR